MHYVLGEPSSTVQTLIDQYRCTSSDAYLIGNCNEDNSDVCYTVDVDRRGTLDLKSEHGRSYTAGFVWDIAEGLSLSTDYYDIRLKDLIKDLNRDEILAADAGCRTGTAINGGTWLHPGADEYCSTIYSRVFRGDADGRITSVERGPINLQLRVLEPLYDSFGREVAVEYVIDF